MRLRIVHISFAVKEGYLTAKAWLNRIDFYTPILDELQIEAEVFHLDMLPFESLTVRNGVHYYSVNSRRLSSWLPLRMIKLAQQLKPDVLMVHGLGYPFQTLLLRLIIGKHALLILQHHAERPAKGLKKIMQRIVDPFISCYFFSTMELADIWIEKGIISSKKKIVEVMEVTSAFPIERDQTTLRTHLNYLWVGRLNANKDPLTLVKAFIDFIPTTKHTNLYLIFQTDELLVEIQQIITGYEKNIHLVGAVDRPSMAKWYKKVNFIVSTSHYEGSGTAICEAMAFGCIPIFTKIASFDVMSDRGAIGLLFKPGDHLSLLNALKLSVDMDQETERKKVFTQFDENLSSRAIAQKMLSIMKTYSLRRLK